MEGSELRSVMMYGSSGVQLCAEEQAVRGEGLSGCIDSGLCSVRELSQLSACHITSALTLAPHYHLSSAHCMTAEANDRTNIVLETGHAGTRSRLAHFSFLHSVCRAAVIAQTLGCTVSRLFHCGILPALRFVVCQVRVALQLCVQFDDCSSTPAELVSPTNRLKPRLPSPTVPPPAAVGVGSAPHRIALCIGNSAIQRGGWQRQSLAVRERR